MAKYSLVGVDGNAFSILGYTARALKNEGLGELVDEMRKKATSGDYWNLVAVCNKYVELANAEAGYDDDEYDYEDEYEDEEDDDGGY